MTTRREFLMAGAAAGAVSMLSEAALAQPMPPRSPMGIASTAMSGHLGGAGGAAPPMRDDSLAYINYCRSLGAGGLQFTPRGDLRQLRRRMEQLDMWFEGEARGAPRTPDGDYSGFEQAMRDIKAMGGKVARYVSPAPQGTSGRRYEAFTSLEQYNEWLRNANDVVLRCLPIAERHGVKIALENHKDRVVDDHLDFIRRTSSEYLGALVDPGNNMSFMEDPVETCTKLAPYVISCSMKDMGVAPYADGFLLSEVLFGTGVTDQKALWGILKAGNPRLNCLHELITRDPLQVPYFKASYWAGMPPKTAAQLAAHHDWVAAHASELPRVSQLTPQERLQAEEDNNRATLDWGRANIT